MHLLFGTTFHYLSIQPPLCPPSEEVSKHTFLTWLPPCRHRCAQRPVDVCGIASTTFYLNTNLAAVPLSLATPGILRLQQHICDWNLRIWLVSHARRCSKQNWWPNCLVYGKKEYENAHWFEESVSTNVPVIDAKRDALIMYKSNPSQQNHQELKTTRSLAQITARHCANNCWLRLSSSIQMAAWSGNIRLMYEGITQETGKLTKRSTLVKSKTGDVIKDSVTICATEPGYAGDIGAIEIWLIDWCSLGVYNAMCGRYLR